LDDHDLVGLIARDPEVVFLVDNDPIRSAASTVDEDLRRTGLEVLAGNRDLHDRVIRRVSDEQRRLRVVEGQAIGAYGGRGSGWLEQRTLDPDGPRAAGRSDFPDHALMRIGHIKVARGVE